MSDVLMQINVSHLLLYCVEMENRSCFNSLASDGVISELKLNGLTKVKVVVKFVAMLRKGIG